jgi:cell division protein FtsA
MIDVASFGDSGHAPVPRRELANILQARAEEMFSLIQKEVKRSGYDGLLPAGLVLTGGVAQLAGLRELGREMLGIPVRIGEPQDIEGLTDTVSSPAHATAVGLLLWGLHKASQSVHSQQHEPRTRMWRAREWLKRLMPRGNA